MASYKTTLFNITSCRIDVLDSRLIQILIQHRSGYKLLPRFSKLFMNTNVKRKVFFIVFITELRISNYPTVSMIQSFTTITIISLLVVHVMME